jgi:hypothetical protein
MFIGLLLLLSGLIVGLGSVSLIATLAFLGRKSTYYSEATTRAHKVSKQLIWLGWLLFLIGTLIYYATSTYSTVWQWQLLIFIPLTLNGIWLTTKVSPYLIKRELLGKSAELLPKKLQSKITISFIISIATWWSEVILLTWYLVN